MSIQSGVENIVRETESKFGLTRQQVGAMRKKLTGFLDQLMKAIDTGQVQETFHIKRSFRIEYRYFMLTVFTDKTAENMGLQVQEITMQEFLEFNVRAKNAIHRTNNRR